MTAVKLAPPRPSCAWCKGPIPAGVRRDAISCSKRCRQARNRFLRAGGSDGAAAAPGLRRPALPRPFRPLLQRPSGLRRRGRPRRPDRPAGRVRRWALSTSADALQDVLPLCPAGVRVAAWHRGERPHRGAQGPLSAWEPVIYFGGRPDLAPYLSRAAESDASRADLHDTSPPGHHDGYPSAPAHHDASTAAPHDGLPGVRRTDSLVYVARARPTDPGWVTGAKPAAFARWLFGLLGAQAGDQLVDLFPGSGGIARAWTAYTAGVSEPSATVV